MQHTIHIKGLQRGFRIYLHISLCIISAFWLSEMYCRAHSSFNTGRYSSAFYRHHLQLLLLLGIESTSVFHISVRVSCLTVSTHLKQLQKTVSGNLFISNLTVIMIMISNCCSVLAKVTDFPLWSVWKFLQQLILRVTSLTIQPVTASVMTTVVTLHLAFIYLWL